MNASTERPGSDSSITALAETNFRKHRRRFGIKRADRKTHMYINGIRSAQIVAYVRFNRPQRRFERLRAPRTVGQAERVRRLRVQFPRWGRHTRAVLLRRGEGLKVIPEDISARRQEDQPGSPSARKVESAVTRRQNHP